MAFCTGTFTTRLYSTTAAPDVISLFLWHKHFNIRRPRHIRWLIAVFCLRDALLEAVGQVLFCVCFVCVLFCVCVVCCVCTESQ